MNNENLIIFIRKYARVFGATFIVILATILSFMFVSLTEHDNIFHIASASLYKENGIFFSNFSWETFSVFSKYKSDIWYGFHLLLSPFVFGQNYLLALQINAAILISVLLLSFYFVLNKLKVSWPILGAIFFIFSSIGEFNRMTNVRPHVLVMAVVILFFYYLAWDKQRKKLFLLCLLVSFLEISMIWLPILIFCLYWLSQNAKHFFWPKLQEIKQAIFSGLVDFSYVFSGLFIGFFVRPNPIAGFYLFYYQIVYLFFAKVSGVMLPWGTEVYRISKDGILSVSPLIFIFAVSYFIWLFNKNLIRFTERENSFLKATFFAAVFFFLMMIFLASRAIDLFSVFSVLSIAVVLPKVLAYLPGKIKNSIVFKTLLFSLFFTFIYGGLLGFSFLHGNYGVKIDDYKPAADYLRENTKPGSVVAHLNFNEYPGLFLWNRSNLYQNHSDPIFAYSYNPEVYKKFVCSVVYFGENNDIYSEYVTADNIRSFCQSVKKEDLAIILKNDMKANYIFLTWEMSKKLLGYMKSNSNFELVFHDSKSYVFKVK